MDTITKLCTRCNSLKPLTEFYVRSGCKNPTEPGHYLSECKVCIMERARVKGNIPTTMPRSETEIYAIRALNRVGIHALPGKAVHAADVDVVAWGCVWLEVKYAKLAFKNGANKFTFTTTTKQMQRGFLAHVVMLICEYPDGLQTYHLFNANDPVFYIERQKYDVSRHEPISEYRIKAGFTFTPGATRALKHGENRVVMVQPMMDASENNWGLIEQWRVYLSEQLRNSV